MTDLLALMMLAVQIFITIWPTKPSVAARLIARTNSPEGDMAEIAHFVDRYTSKDSVRIRHRLETCIGGNAHFLWALQPIFRVGNIGLD